MTKEVFSRSFIIDGVARTIRIKQGDITEDTTKYDLLLCSSFHHCYSTEPKTVLKSLEKIGINVGELSKDPGYDGGDAGFWISKPLESNLCSRICCIELSSLVDKKDDNQDLVFGLVSTFIAKDKKYHFKKIASPLLGTGLQGLNRDHMINCLIELVMDCFNHNKELTEFCLFDYKGNNSKRLIYEVENKFGKTFDVFISYSRNNLDEIYKFVSGFESLGLKVWFDKEISGSEKFTEAIQKAISKSRTVFFLWTPDSDDLNCYCFKEIDWAFSLGIPVYIYQPNKFKHNDEHETKVKDYQWVTEFNAKSDDIPTKVLELVSEIKNKERVIQIEDDKHTEKDDSKSKSEGKKRSSNVLQRIHLIEGSIENCKEDAIAYLTSSDLKPVGKVASLIFKKAGWNDLSKACSPYQHSEPGSVTITSGFRFGTKYILHAVGQNYIYNDPEQSQQNLEQVYNTIFLAAKEYKIRTIGMPCLGGGVFNYPVDLAAKTAIRSILNNLCEDDYEVYIYLSKPKMLIYKELLKELSNEY